MEFVNASKLIAEAVLRALPTRINQEMNLQEDVLSDPRALIDEVAICNTVCMHYVCMTSQ